MVRLMAIGWMALDPASGVLVALVSSPLTIYAGSRIWRAGHPAANVWRELGRRGPSVAGFIATLVAVGFIQAFPQVVFAIIALWSLAIVVLVVGAALASWGIQE